MTTVPKLSYTNIKSKSKNKVSLEKAEIQSNQLFSHMNQDKLKYLDSQIKQKKKNSLTVSANLLPQETDGSLSYESAKKLNLIDHARKRVEPTQLISEKQSKYESTSRELFAQNQELDDGIIAKTQGQSQLQLLSENNKSQDQDRDRDPHKISYYDLISQAKSKKLTSHDGKANHQYSQKSEVMANKDSNMIQFIEQYVSNLQSNNSKHCKSSQHNHRNSGQLAELRSQKNILLNALQMESKKCQTLAKMVEQSENNRKMNEHRVQYLQQTVHILKKEIEGVKSCYQSLQSSRKSGRQSKRVKFGQNNGWERDQGYDSTNGQQSGGKYGKAVSRHQGQDRLRALQQQLFEFIKGGTITLHNISSIS